jgi:hypothetical protein
MTEFVELELTFSTKNNDKETITVVVDKKITVINRENLVGSLNCMSLKKISGLENLVNLKSIVFNCESFTGLHDLEGIEKLDNLESVELGYNHTINSCQLMKNHGIIYHFKKLNFYESQTTNDDFLMYLPDLEELDLSYCNIGSNDFKIIHSKLKSLVLLENDISNINFMHNYENLTKLVIYAGLIDVDCFNIIPHKNLEWLDISGTQTEKPVDFSVFNKFEKLKKLIFNGIFTSDYNYDNGDLCINCGKRCGYCNPIKKNNVSNNIFESMTLEYIDISNIIGLYIDDIRFGYFPNLKNLQMSNNCIINLSFINDENFPCITKLRIDKLVENIGKKYIIDKIDSNTTFMENMLLVTVNNDIPITSWQSSNYSPSNDWIIG